MENVEKHEKKEKTSREAVILRTSGLGIGVNVLVAVTKLIVGALTSSIAIVSEGVNNLTDVLTSVLTIIGTKLSKKHPDEKHPFGYGRIEYLTGLTIAVLILVTGVEMLISSVKLIFYPEPLAISYVSLAIVAASAVAKYILGVYTIKKGKETGSSALEAVGLDCRNDSFASIITIITAIVFLIFHYSIDAYAGMIISALIIKAGVGVLKDTLAELIGRPGEHELAMKLYKEIRSTPGILAAVDMMLHNYGPDYWSGSVNVEIDHKKTVGEVYRFLHALQLRIMQEYGVVMVFGLYAVDNDHEEIEAIRRTIGAFTKKNPHTKSFHAVYVDEATKTLYCDFIVDYALKDWEALEAEFRAYFKERYPEMNLTLTIETEFVG